MDRKPNYYDLLGIQQTANADEVKAAYRRLAREYHPDIHPNKQEAEARFKQIGEAYTVLSNPQKRSTYDLSLGIKKQRAASQQGSVKEAPKAKTNPGSAQKARREDSPKKPASSETKSTPPPKSASTVDTQGTKFKEMFDTLFRKPEPQEKPNNTSQQKPPPSASQKPQGEQPLRGEDITVDMLISREDAQTGMVKTVQVQHTEGCRRCSATGKVNGVPCSVCHGEKQIVTVRKIDVRVPAGVKAGSKVRVAKEGGRGIAGGESGDLFLVVKIEEDQFLKIDGLNVSCDLPVSIVEAVLGAEIDVPTIHGKVKMVIPPQTNSGRVFRLKGQGVTLNGATGDQYVTVQIVAPKTLSAKERELYEQLSKLSTDSPRDFKS